MTEDNKKTSPTSIREEEILKDWKDKDIFEKSLSKDAPNGEFVFYDGPPFATGLPHYGSLLSSVIKDAVGRYKTMRGYTVPRRWGWDCHGLPIENMIEQKLELKTKKDIEELGIDVFNEEARKTVLAYADEWKKYIERIGRWVHFDNSYKTMDNTYIESVWWALKKIQGDKRLYEGKKVLMYCPRCETPLSKAEIAMDNSYKDVTEEAVFVKFKVTAGQKIGKELVADDSTYILAWTTTPWTLPGNVALAVGTDVDYAVVKKDKELYIVATQRFSSLESSGEVIEELKGSDLVGIAYEPLYTVEKAKNIESEKAWTVLPGDFVTTEEGTGVVHIAPMYGEDDYNLGLQNTLPVVPILDATGTYNNDAPELLRGMYYKKGGKYVMEDLEKRNLLFKKHSHTHSYPHCYRCGTALIYNALTSWFIDIQSVKKRLLEANEEVSWYPEHLKHGRFQNIVESAPDWTISRNRFWASPLPIWKHEKTGEVTVIGSLKELREKTKKSGNTYIFVRHGQAESNVTHIISSLPENAHSVTEQGVEQIKEAGKELKKIGITKIIASPLLRTKESAEIIAKEIGYDAKDIVIESRFQEWQLGDLNGLPVSNLRDEYANTKERFTKQVAGRESLVSMKSRIGEALYELERTYQNETIVVVCHEYTAWLAECVAKGADIDACIAIRGDTEDFVKNGEIRTVEFVPLPHNKKYELDLHRPYIDDLVLVAQDGGRLVRIPEVVDCWVESGSMPFASEYYPHGNKELVERRYPGDFIAEYIAQTRTWFYYMHAMGVLLFDAPSFKNCVTTGTLLAADGAKISKSKKNFTDPTVNIDLYGADAMRMYMLGSVVMAAEDVAFKDEELRDVHNRFINMLWNSYKFYEMHADPSIEPAATSPYVLDRWILARLDEVVSGITEYMDAYDTVRSTRMMKEFVADLSQWYIRRSRNRFKSDDVEDKHHALATTRYVLLTFSKLIAPITPFVAEGVYRGVLGESESVHLDVWPATGKKGDTDLVLRMKEVRDLASLALEQRQRAGIKVRQPLAAIIVSETTLEASPEMVEILLDEINVKELRVDTAQEEKITLDTKLTPELLREGVVRDIIRAVQDMRKKNDLVPEDSVSLSVYAENTEKEYVEAATEELKRVAGVSSVTYSEASKGESVPVNDSTIRIELYKE